MYRFGWNWTGVFRERKKKKLTTVEVRSIFPKLIIPESTSTHGSIHRKPWDQPVFEFSERISQIYGLKQKHASKLKGEPSKLDEQTLPKAIPQFPCKFPEQLLCI